MIDSPNIDIRVESPLSDAGRDLLARSGAWDDGDDDLYGPNAEFLIARTGGRPVGCIALVDRVQFGEARRLYVDPEMRGNGIGAALVRKLEAAARDIGLRVVRIAPTRSGSLGPAEAARFGYHAALASDPGDALEKRL